MAAAQRALDGLAASLSSDAEHGKTPVRLRVSPWRDEADAGHKLMLWLAMGMVSGLLLIACANLTSILLARGVARRRDYAIRLAAGATRSRLMRQSLIEVCLLAFTALPLACGGAVFALRLIRAHLSVAQTQIPNLVRIHMNGECLLFSFAIALGASLLCGLLPAFSATSIDLSTGLRETGTQIAGGRPLWRLLYLLVAVEAGICMLLLSTSGLLVRGLVRLISEDHGLKPDRVLTVRLPTGSWQQLSRKQTPEEQQGRIQHYLELMRQVEPMHGVEAAALASSLPLSHTVVRTRMRSPHRTTATDASEIMPICQAVTRDYFRVMGIPLVSGRSFDVSDAASKLKVGVVNESFARKYFDSDPIGRFLYEPDDQQPIQIIGIVRDSPHLDLAEQIKPEVYLNFEQTLLTPFLTGLAVRTRGDPEPLVKTLRMALSLNSADQPVVHIETLKALIDENVWQRRFSAWLFSAFACLALCLSGIGIYGVVSYITTSRRRDFGIHVSLGAGPGRIFYVAAYQNLLPVTFGIVAGLSGSYWTSKWIAALLYKTGPFDAVTTVASIAILAAAAFAAVTGPALRAMRVDPAITLRCE